jgi:glyoxylase I family protein
LRLHHHAYAVKDQEVNRHFVEDILGIPLVATWCERVFRPEVGEAWDKNRAILQEVGGSWHVAFKVTQAAFDELMQRVTAANVPVRKIDHGYCVSMYLKSPDGLRLEFTVDPADAEQIAAMRRKDAHSELARWLAGDRRTNNGDRPH